MRRARPARLPVGRLAVGSPPQRRGIRLGLGAGEEPSVERPAAEVGPLRVRLGARRALRRGQQVGERLRPVWRAAKEETAEQYASNISAIIPSGNSSDT